MNRESLIKFLPFFADVCRSLAREVEAAYSGDEMWEARALGIADMGDELDRLAEKMKEGEND